MEGSDYYQHYVDSFAIQKGYLVKRDRLTIGVIVMFFLMTMSFGDPESTEKLSKEIQEVNLGSVTFSYGVVNVIINFIFLWVVMQYYQINLIIERMYSYIHRLEAYLSTKEFKIDRESGNYMDDYPMMSYVTHRIFVLLFPLLILLVAFVKLLDEINSSHTLVWLNIIILVLSIVLTILYLSNRWFDESAFSKKKNPNLKTYERIKLYFKQETE